MKELETLMNYQKRIAELEYILNLLSWDMRVHSPKGGKEYVVEVKTKLEGEVFQLKTQKEYQTLLSNFISSEEFSRLDEKRKKYFQKTLEDLEKNQRVPASFYQEYRKEIDLSNIAWEEAKEKNDYEIFKPHLEKMISMTKEFYHYQEPNKNLYDVMLDSYEKGMTTKEIDPLFEELKKELIPLLKEVSFKQKHFLPFQKEYSETELVNCANYLLNYIGFDLNRGGLGIYPHGFTMKVHPNDVRIAFSKNENPFSFVSTIIHEGGHGIFEQNIDSNLRELDNDGADHIYGLHESQSRFFENILGRNIHFWEPIYADMKQLLQIDFSLKEFVDRLNEVKLGPIRTDADELSYCLHIIIRYEIERDLFNDKISVSELPQIWNQKTKEYLGIEIQNDREGILQDVHWSEGDFGYFPSYLLGNIYDGMLRDAIEENLGSIDTILQNREISKIKDFLIQHIYQYGNTKSAKELLEEICHKEISAEPIIRYFKEKYRK